MKNRMKLTLTIGVAVFAIALTIPSCKNEKDQPLNDMKAQAMLLNAVSANQQPGTNLEVSGNWSDNYGGTHSINSAQWTENYNWGGPVTYLNSIAEYDNATNTLYYLTPANAFNPNTYSRIVWTEPNAATSTFYYCIVVFGKADLPTAKSDPATADSTDPANGGCGGFSWTKMTAM